MSSPNTITMPSATSRPVLPYDIQLEILDHLIAQGKDDTSIKVSTLATVCKSWQYVVERQLFRRLIIVSGDMPWFAAYTIGRTHLVKHIRLEVLVPEERSLSENECWFTNITQVLSSWNCHGITLEIGVERPRFLPSKRIFSLKRPSGAPFGGPSESLWRAKATSLMNTPVAFQQSKLLPPFLPQVKCISKLSFRHGYFQKVDPITLTVIMSALTCLKFVHIATSAYGKAEADEAYHSWFLSTFKLPQSVQDISFYQENATLDHQRQTETNYTGLHTNLIRSLIERTENLENLAISFACETEDLFTPAYVSRFKNLKTLALTSRALILPDDRSINDLLCHVADAAREMPKLETLELWYYRVLFNRDTRDISSQVAIFTFRRLDHCNSSISWKSTSSFEMSHDTQARWESVIGVNDADFSVTQLKLDPNLMYKAARIREHLALEGRILPTRP